MTPFRLLSEIRTAIFYKAARGGREIPPPSRTETVDRFERLPETGTHRQYELKSNNHKSVLG